MVLITGRSGWRGANVGGYLGYTHCDCLAEWRTVIPGCHAGFFQSYFHYKKFKFVMSKLTVDVLEIGDMFAL